MKKLTGRVFELLVESRSSIPVVVKPGRLNSLDHERYRISERLGSTARGGADCRAGAACE